MLLDAFKRFARARLLGAGSGASATTRFKPINEVITALLICEYQAVNILKLIRFGNVPDLKTQTRRNSGQAKLLFGVIFNRFT